MPSASTVLISFDLAAESDRRYEAGPHPLCSFERRELAVRGPIRMTAELALKIRVTSSQIGKSMLRRLFLLLSILACTLVAHADDASKLAKIQEFFKVSKMDQMMAQVMKQTMDQVNSGMTQQIMGVQLSPDQQQKVDQLTDKVRKIVSGALSWDNLEPEYAKIYADAYTEQQIDDILAFYKSPTGQAMVEKAPDLIKQASAISHDRLAVVIPELQKLMKDFAAQESTGKPQEKPKE